MEDAGRTYKSKRLKASAGIKALAATAQTDDDTESTEFKLALLASLHPDRSSDIHLDYLLAYHGDVTKASHALSGNLETPLKRKRAAANGYQSSLHSFAIRTDGDSSSVSPIPVKRLTKKGKTLHLYSPVDIEQHTPCSVVHNFLPSQEADALLRELLQEAPSFRKETFQLFERTVESPHTIRFYVDNLRDVQEQQTEYVYNGSYIPDVAQTTPEMLRVSGRVREQVNKEIERRIRDFYPGGKKLKFQSPDEWKPNTSFVNCYDGGAQNVGYHSDQLTYLGPRSSIGSLSLGVTREFRVRRIVPGGDPDEQGQIAIHLPHNSLLVMHAECQEEWKHSIAPAQAIDPHPLAGLKRINITYRCYKEYLHPRYTPKCRCGMATILRCIQKQQNTRGRYVWMCYVNYTPGQSGCSFFQWAELDDDGRPPWAEGYKGDCNGPIMPVPSDASMTDTQANQEGRVTP